MYVIMFSLPELDKERTQSFLSFFLSSPPPPSFSSSFVSFLFLFCFACLVLLYHLYRP